MSYTSVNAPNKSMLHITFTLLWCVGYVCLSAIDLNAFSTEEYGRRRHIHLSSTPPADTVYFTLTTQVVGHATNCTAKPVEKNEGIAKTMYCRAIRQDGKIEYRYASLLLSEGVRYLNIYRLLVNADTLSIDDVQYRDIFNDFDDELFILRYLTPQYPIRLDTTSIKRSSSSPTRPPLTMAQKIEECITSNGHGEMEVLMKKSHDVWSFDPICGEIVGRVYRREGGIFAYKMSLTVEETRVTSAANCSTTRKIDFQQLEDHQLIGKLKLRFD